MSEILCKPDEIVFFLVALTSQLDDRLGVSLKLGSLPHEHVESFVREGQLFLVRWCGGLLLETIPRTIVHVAWKVHDSSSTGVVLVGRFLIYLIQLIICHICSLCIHREWLRIVITAKGWSCIAILRLSQEEIAAIFFGELILQSLSRWEPLLAKNVFARVWLLLNAL